VCFHKQDARTSGACDRLKIKKKKAMQASLFLSIGFSRRLLPFAGDKPQSFTKNSDDRSHPGEDGNRECACAKKNVDDGKCHNKR
jgi:hypothetical protein